MQLRGKSVTTMLTFCLLLSGAQALKLQFQAESSASRPMNKCRGHCGPMGDGECGQEPDLHWCCHSCNCKDMSDEGPCDGTEGSGVGTLAGMNKVGDTGAGSCGMRMCGPQPCRFCVEEGHHNCCDSNKYPTTESYCHPDNRGADAKVSCQGTDLPEGLPNCEGLCGEKGCQMCNEAGCCEADVQDFAQCSQDDPDSPISCLGSLPQCGQYGQNTGSGTAICVASDSHAEPCQYCDTDGCCHPVWDLKHECEAKNPSAQPVCTGWSECARCCADHFFTDDGIEGTVHDCVQDCTKNRGESTSRYNAAWCNNHGGPREINCDICEGHEYKHDAVAGFFCDNDGYEGDTNELGGQLCKTKEECLAKGPNAQWRDYDCELVYHMVGGKYKEDMCPAAIEYWKTGGLSGGCCEGGGGKAHSHGDPHLKNLKGEKFNVIQQGYAPLLKVPSDSAALLKIMGVIAGADKCDKTTFITRLNVSGSWLEKTLVVGVPDQLNTDQAFYVTVDQQNVWSPKKGRDLPEWQKYFFPERIQRRAMVFEHESGKFSISELDNSQTSAKAPGVQIHLSMHPNLLLKITRPMYAKGQAHLNLDINGLRSVSQTVGGLLGTDDYSDWTQPSQDCVNLSKRHQIPKFMDGINFVKTNSNSQINEKRFYRNSEPTPEMEEIASASY